MKVDLLSFGRIEVEGRLYEHDIVIDAGEVRKRRKSPSKAFRGEYGHTPLSAAEEIPWGGVRLVVGTGANGALPIMPEVYQVAHERGIEVVAVPTAQACRLLAEVDRRDVRAVLHVTC